MLKEFRIKIIKYLFIMICFFMMLLSASSNDVLRLPVAIFFGCEEYLTVNNGPDEIGGWINEVRESNNDYTKIILGDSVCCQMFAGLQWCNDEICMAGSNGAITMAGQYILLNEFLNNHDNVSDVWLIVLPYSLQVYVNKNVGYQYVVMPFVESNTISLLDTNTVETIKHSFGGYAVRTDFVSFLDKSIVGRKLYLNYILNNFKEPDEEWPISIVSMQYIKKMKELCDKKGVVMHLLPAPMPNNQQSIDFVNVFKGAFNSSELSTYFPEYIDAISFYPEEQFGDGTHFSGEYAERSAYDEKIKEMYSYDSLLEYLKFE